MNKQITLEQAVEKVHDGMTIMQPHPCYPILKPYIARVGMGRTEILKKKDIIFSSGVCQQWTVQDTWFPFCLLKVP